MITKIANWVKSHQYEVFVGVCVILIGVISYNLGRIQALRKTDIAITTGAPIYLASSPTDGADPNSQQANIIGGVQPDQKVLSTQPRDLRVVASKASTTHKYHFVWCPGAKKIKESNKLWFENEAAAIAAGYTLAGNCTK